MSFPHFGHPYGSASQFLMSASSGATCCDTAPRSVPDVAAGSAPAAALCCAPYENRLLGSARPELGAALGIYGAPYAAAAAAQSYPGYLPYTSEAPALYGALNPQYEFKETAGNFTPGLAQAGAYYSYEPTLGQYQYDRYGAVELSSSGRRKNATRETTSTLKAWLNEHRKNPYPTKGEKIMLAIITKMTLTQVSTWFANARRRLKKENKMTWAPKNKGGEDRKAEGVAEESLSCLNGDSKDVTARQEARGLRLSDLEDLEEEEEEEDAEEEEAVAAATNRLAAFHKDTQTLLAPCAAAPEDALKRRACILAAPHFSCNEPRGSGEADFLQAEPEGPTLTVHYAPSPKPRIWSLARTAAASALEGAPSPPMPRSPECRRLMPRELPGLGTRPAISRESACEEPPRVAKAFGMATFALQRPPQNCPLPCARWGNPAVPCQYPSSGAEGSGPLAPRSRSYPKCICPHRGAAAALTGASGPSCLRSWAKVIPWHS